MAFIPSKNAQNLAKQIGLELNLILEIDGIPIKFGSQEIGKYWKFDEGFLFDTAGLRFDTPFPDPDARDYLSLENTSKSLSSQVLPDKKGTSSTLRMTVELVDFNGEVTELLKNGNYVEDVLGQRAQIFIGHKAGSHPEDSVPVINGIVDTIKPMPNGYVITIAHAENRKRQQLFQTYTSSLTQRVQYKEIDIADLRYTQRDVSASTLSIQYVAGSPVSADITGNIITIVMQNGVTKAKQILDAISASGSVSEVVNVSVIGDRENIQNTFALTAFTIDTVLNVTSTNNLLPSQDALTTYVQIDEEIMEVVSFTDTTITVNRGSLSSPASHDSGTEMASIYNLSGNAIDLALKLYLSGDEPTYVTLGVTSFVDIEGESYSNAIYFANSDIEDDWGVTAGDTVVITGATNPANNGTFIIQTILNAGTGQYIITDNTGVVFEIDTSASCAFQSQYNTLPTGCNLTPFDVDVSGHQEIYNTFAAGFLDYSFYLKDSINVKEFVDGELFYPCALYSINRNAQIGLKYTSPPFANQTPVSFNSSNIINIHKIKVERSLNKFNYNAVTYRFGEDVLTGEFKEGYITLNEDARNRLNKDIREYKVESKGLTLAGGGGQLALRQTARIFQRYQYGATLYSNVEVLFQYGWNIEIGDVVLFGGADVKLPDLTDGTTYTGERLVEVVNKDFDLVTGTIKLSFLNTGFDIGVRYAVVSPSSYLDSGSTTTSIKLKKSFDTGQYLYERQKWESFVGQKIRVRSDDFTFNETVTISALSLTNENEFIVSPALSLAPLENYLIEIPKYDVTSAANEANYKLVYAYLNKQTTVTAVTDNQIFDVDDASEFIDGGKLQLRSDDFTNDSGSVEIDTVVGNTITLVEALSFTPIIGDRVENLTFADGGSAYFLI